MSLIQKKKILKTNKQKKCKLQKIKCNDKLIQKKKIYKTKENKTTKDLILTQKIKSYKTLLEIIIKKPKEKNT